MQKKSGERIIDPVTFKGKQIRIPIDDTFQGINIDDHGEDTTISYTVNIQFGFCVGVMVLSKGEATIFDVGNSQDKATLSIQNIPDEACEDQVIPVFPQLSQIIS